MLRLAPRRQGDHPGRGHAGEGPGGPDVDGHRLQGAAQGRACQGGRVALRCAPGAGMDAGAGGSRVRARACACTRVRGVACVAGVRRVRDAAGVLHCAWCRAGAVAGCSRQRRHPGRRPCGWHRADACWRQLSVRATLDRKRLVDSGRTGARRARQPLEGCGGRHARPWSRPCRHARCAGDAAACRTGR